MSTFVLRRDLPVPSTKILQHLTSKASTISDSNFIKRIVSPLPDEQKEDKVCQMSLSVLFREVSDYFDFGMKAHHAKIIANVCLKNYCKASTPRDSKEARVKILKLSD